jgi:uncharacterized protein
VVKKFLVDQMLIRLGRWLRLAGQDVENPGEDDDQMLAKRAKMEGRVLITRDRGLADLCQRSGTDCMLIASDRLGGQLVEMEMAGVELKIAPNRCTICNGVLLEAPAEARPDHLDEKQVWRCEACGKLYWHGSHWKKICERFEELRSGNDQAKTM